MMQDIKAIPTVYANTQFRSRLEARWAAFFDIQGWTWQYEPLDLNGYLPDFIIEGTNPCIGRRRLIEVKPAMAFAEYEEAQLKVEQSGWRGKASCVGALIGQHPLCSDALLGVEWIDGEYWVPWEGLEFTKALADWRKAGNLVQWKSPVKQEPVKSHRKLSELEKPVPKEEVMDFFRTFACEDQ